jgi:hypothetical protein
MSLFKFLRYFLVFSVKTSWNFWFLELQNLNLDFIIIEDNLITMSNS